MDVDFGKNVHGIVNKFHERWNTIKFEGEEINITRMDSRIFDINDNTILLGDSRTKNGLIAGIYQTEKYFDGIEDNVRNWFKIKKEYEDLYQKKLDELGIELNDDTCVINFRGGEYRGIPKVVCRKEYWKNSIEHLQKNNP
jgi:hypothetical protein